MPFATSIVPMPRWSAAAGCAKFGLAIIILAFVAACTAIWGGPAFSITLFTAAFSLIAFGYYLTALSLRTSIYNKWVVLTLEALLTTFWLVCLILLAGWTAESARMPRWILSTPVFYETSSEDDVAQFGPQRPPNGLSASWTSLPEMIRRELEIMPSTPVRVHGQDAQAAARVLAGISTALAGLLFVLHAATFVTFALNFNKPIPHIQPSSDEESQPSSPEDGNNLAPPVQPVSPATPTFTQPLRVDTLPKEFEPKPQTQEHYLNPQEAAEAGIEPPTPILKAQRAEKEIEAEKAKDTISLSTMFASGPADKKKNAHNQGI